MGTWTNGSITRKKNTTFGGMPAVIYTIASVTGDTGGVLTTKFTNIEYAMPHAQKAAAGHAIVSYISGKTVVCAYADPTEDLTVKILVVQG